MLCANRIFSERNTPQQKQQQHLHINLDLDAVESVFHLQAPTRLSRSRAPTPDTVYQMVSIGLCVCCLFVCPAYCENNIVHISISLYIYISGVYLLIAAFGAVFPIISRIGPEVIVPLECRNSKLHSKYFAHSQLKIYRLLPIAKRNICQAKDLSVSILYF